MNTKLQTLSSNLPSKNNTRKIALLLKASAKLNKFKSLPKFSVKGLTKKRLIVERRFFKQIGITGKH